MESLCKSPNPANSRLSRAAGELLASEFLADMVFDVQGSVHHHKLQREAVNTRELYIIKLKYYNFWCVSCRCGHGGGERGWGVSCGGGGSDTAKVVQDICS